jgi:hypothetical protein
VEASDLGSEKRALTDTWWTSSFGQCMVGEGVEGEQVLLGVLEQRGHLGQRLAQALERVGDELAGRIAIKDTTQYTNSVRSDADPRNKG